jgi:hypothetical protein
MSRDIRLENNDLYIDGNIGDFAIGESDPQHVQDILNSYAGWWKQFPTLGVGLKRFLGKSGGIQLVKREIGVHLKADGYRVDNIVIKGEEVYLTGERIKK